MEQRGITNPYFAASQPPENHLRELYGYQNSPEMAPQSPFYSSSSSSADQSLSQSQTLVSALSRLNLSSSDFRHPHHQTPPFRLPPATISDVEANPLVGCYYPMGLREQQLQQLSNVGLMNAAQNGVMGYFGGGHMDYTVGPGPGPGPGVNLGGGVGFTEPSPAWFGDHEAAARLNLEVLNQRGYYDHDPFLQYKKLVPRKINTLYPNLPQNDGYDGLIDGLVSKSSNFTRPNSYNDKQISEWKEQINMFPIEDVRGEIVSLAKDQSGSKILQMKMEEPNEEEIELVLSEVIEYVSDLMKNQYGSYFIQKLFGVCNEEQRTRIIVAVTKTSYQLVGVCLNPHGTKAMQKLLENLNTPQQISLVMSALSPAVVALANDPNGQHVVQYCVMNFSYEYNKHLLSEIAENCIGIATDKSGCCVLQSCVDHSHGEPRERLICKIIANAVHLTEDPYGNYVVQHLLGLRIPEVTEDLLRRLQGCFASLSCNKYASNVVEKFLKSGEEHATKVILELLSRPNAAMLLVDPFGNYVIQSALSVSKGHVHNALLNLIRVNAPSMRSNIYGKKILAWLDKRKAPLCKDVQK